MFDVIIIGAGAAGLACARDLSGAGKRLCILEARDRIGGRIFTIHTPDLPLPIELGAEFVHGSRVELKGTKLKLEEMDGRQMALLDGRLVTRDYGARILAALPPARRTRSLDEVRAFFGAD